MPTVTAVGIGVVIKRLEDALTLAKKYPLSPDKTKLVAAIGLAMAAAEDELAD